MLYFCLPHLSEEVFQNIFYLFGHLGFLNLTGE